MGFQYKFDIEGKVYDLIPNYPQENTIDLNVLNQLCYLFRYEQETYKKPKQREEDTYIPIIEVNIK